MEQNTFFYLSEIFFYPPVPFFFQFTTAKQTWSTSHRWTNFGYVTLASKTRVALGQNQNPTPAQSQAEDKAKLPK